MVDWLRLKVVTFQTLHHLSTGGELGGETPSANLHLDFKVRYTPLTPLKRGHVCGRLSDHILT